MSDIEALLSRRLHEIADGFEPSPDLEERITARRGSPAVAPARRRGHPRLWVAALAVAAVAVVAALLVDGIGPTAPGPQSGQWHVVDSVTPVPFQVRSSVSAPLATALPPFSLSGQEPMDCPSAQVCYVVAGLGGRLTVPVYGSLWRTGDGGVAWTALGLPSGLGPSSDPSCPTVSTCLVGGIPTATATDPHVISSGVLLVTGDAGATWRTLALPGPGLAVQALSCWSATSCTVQMEGTWATGSHDTFSLWRTADAGGVWSAVALPRYAVAGGLRSFDCPSPSVCVGATGIHTALPPSRDGSPGGSVWQTAVYRTADAGRSWALTRFPDTFDGISPVVCPDVGHCDLVVTAVSGSGQTLHAGANLLVSTADGGRTWTSGSPLPASFTPVPSFSLDCAGSGTCVVAGATIVSSKRLPPNSVENNLVPAILTTRPSGPGWQAARLAPSVLHSSGYGSVGEMSCTPDLACLAIVGRTVLTNEP